VKEATVADSKVSCFLCYRVWLLGCVQKTSYLEVTLTLKFSYENLTVVASCIRNSLNLVQRTVSHGWG